MISYKSFILVLGALIGPYILDPEINYSLLTKIRATFFGLLGAYLFCKILENLYDWKEFFVTLLVITVTGYLVFGWYFQSFFAGYALEVLYSLICIYKLRKKYTPNETLTELRRILPKDI